MQILAIIGQKGGSGKSTLARAIAVEAVRNGQRVALLDADPQGTVVKWRARREAEAPTVVAVDGAAIEPTLKQLRAAGADLVVIDTPPHLRATVGIVSRVADAIIVPTRPTPEDLESLGETLGLVRGGPREPRTGLVFNAVPPRSAQLVLAKAAVAAFGLPVSPVAITERVGHPYASAEGLTAPEREPGSPAAGEIQLLWAWIRKSILVS